MRRHLDLVARTQLGGDLVELGGGSCRQMQTAALGRQRPGDGKADAFRPAGDERAAAGEIEVQAEISPKTRLSSSAKADDPVITVPRFFVGSGAYWMPACAGMTRFGAVEKMKGRRQAAPSDYCVCSSLLSAPADQAAAGSAPPAVSCPCRLRSAMACGRRSRPTDHG